VRFFQATKLEYLRAVGDRGQLSGIRNSKINFTFYTEYILLDYHKPPIRETVVAVERASARAV
jgi:hypothetical protein